MTRLATEEVRDGVASGLETTFSFDIELRQAVAFWLDRTVDCVSVSASVRYDGLIDRYRVRRIVDGQVGQTQVVEEEAALRQLLTTLEQLSLFSTRDLEANGDYSVRVRVGRRPRTGWLRWPWRRAAALGRASFTFLPQWTRSLRRSRTQGGRAHGRLGARRERTGMVEQSPTGRTPTQPGERRPLAARAAPQNSLRVVLVTGVLLVGALAGLIWFARRFAGLAPVYLSEVVLYALPATCLIMLRLSGL